MNGFNRNASIRTVKENRKMTMRRLKKTLTVLSLGGSTFAFGLSNWSCTSNNNVAAFYQQAGSAAIDAFFDPARAFGADFTAIVVNPASNLVQSMWNNRVATTIPQDPFFLNGGLVE